MSAARWDESAGAWLAELGADGDFTRRFVLDAPMLAHITARGGGDPVKADRYRRCPYFLIMEWSKPA